MVTHSSLTELNSAQSEAVNLNMEISDMKLDVSFEEADGYLLVRVMGKWTPDAVRQGIEDVAQGAQERGYTRILLDLRKLSAPKTEFARYLAGKHIAEVWSQLKVAAVSPANLINKFAENTAVNRGANLTVLFDFNEALAWLMRSATTESNPTSD